MSVKRSLSLPKLQSGCYQMLLYSIIALYSSYFHSVFLTILWILDEEVNSYIKITKINCLFIIIWRWPYIKLSLKVLQPTPEVCSTRVYVQPWNTYGNYNIKFISKTNICYGLPAKAKNKLSWGCQP